MIVVIPGRPIPQQRPRFAKGHAYDPSAKDKREFMLKCVEEQLPEGIAGPLSIDLTFEYKRPKTHFRTGKFSHIMKEDAPMIHTQTPDLDNLVKFVLDALNGKYYIDDRQIYKITARKKWSETDQTIVKII